MSTEHQRISFGTWAHDERLLSKISAERESVFLNTGLNAQGGRRLCLGSVALWWAPGIVGMKAPQEKEGQEPESEVSVGIIGEDVVKGEKDGVALLGDGKCAAGAKSKGPQASDAISVVAVEAGSCSKANGESGKGVFGELLGALGSGGEGGAAIPRAEVVGLVLDGDKDMDEDGDGDTAEGGGVKTAKRRLNERQCPQAWLDERDENGKPINYKKDWKRASREEQEAILQVRIPLFYWFERLNPLSVSMRPKTHRRRLAWASARPRQCLCTSGKPHSLFHNNFRLTLAAPSPTPHPRCLPFPRPVLNSKIQTTSSEQHRAETCPGSFHCCSGCLFQMNSQCTIFFAPLCT